MRSRVLVVGLALALGSGSTAVASAQQSTASLSGTVTSESGQPLAGVCVDVFGEQAFQSTETGADGRYSFVELPAGEYAVAFNSCEQPLDGFVSELYDDAGANEPPTPVLLEAGEVTTGIDAVLMPGSTITGTVTADSDARPLQGVCVFAFSDETGTFGQDRTDASGRYALTTLRGGDYQVVFHDCAEPFTFLAEAYDDVPADSGFFVGPGAPPEPTPVTVADRGQVAGIDAGLAEGGSVQGTVTALHTGEPVDGVCVALVPADGGDQGWPSGMAYTGMLPNGDPSRGEYVVGSVRPGTYLLGVNPQQICGDDSYTAQWFDGETRPEDAEPVVVGVGDVMTGFDAVIAPRPSISAACETWGQPVDPQFTDVPDGNLHGPAIDCIARRGIASGRGDGTFGPIEDVTREQLASFVARTLVTLGVELPARPRDSFSDDEGSVHELAIDQLSALGIVNGTGERRFDPLGTVTRGQIATFLVRAYEAATGNELRIVRDSFADDERYVHEANINRAATAGMAVGRTTTAYQPLATVSREHMATFLARLVNRVLRDQPFEPFGPPVPAPMGSPAAELASFSATPGAGAGLLSTRSR